MERKIGEIFEYNGEWYQCLTGYCKDCAFLECKDYCKDLHRKDICTANLIFKKLEKVGEPTVIRGKPHQKFNNFVFRNSRICQYCAFHHKLCDVKCEPYEFYLEIKQTKEDMEEKKDNYDGYMDKECIPICDALNSIPNVQTTESCCGHCRDRFMIFLTCDNPHSLAIIARVFDRRYIGTSQPWHIELQTKDSGAYDYLIHSETKYDSEEVMMKDVNQIIENIEHWCDDKFASHFKGCDDTKHSNSEKIGKNLKPFDLEAAKAGKPVCTRDGRKARIICWDRIDSTGCNLPIVVLVQCEETEVLQLYHDDGKCDVKADLDLMMLPEKKEGWVNIYKSDRPHISSEICDIITGVSVFETKEGAISYIDKDKEYITTVKIEYEE